VAVVDYITLDGTRYDLDTDPEVEPSAQIPQKLFQAADEGDFWQTWELRSHHNGERRTRIISKDQVAEFTYDDGEGVDVSTWGQLKLQPDLNRTDGLTVSSATLPMVVSNDGSTVIIGHTALGGKYITTYTGTTFTGRTTPNAAAVTDLCVGIGSNVYGIQGTKIIVSANDGATWADDASSGVPTTMVGLTVAATYLYALTPTSLVYWDGASWETAASFGGDFICTYGEQVYWADGNILYRYNGTSAYEADRLPQGFVCTGLFSYRNILFIPGYFNVQGGKRGTLYYIMDGRDAHLYNIGSYDGTSNYTISAVAGSDDEVYVSNQKRGGADRYDLTVGGLSSGPAWRAAGVIPFKSMAYSNGKLLVGRYDGVAGTDGVYVANVAIPTAYETSGWLTTPEYDWFFPNDYKIFSRIVVEHKSLAASESIKIEYSVDGGVAYTLAGYSDVPSTTFKEFKTTNARGRSLKLRITLAGPGTSTPTVNYVRVDAAPVGEARSLFDYNLALWSPKQGRVKIAKLKETYKTRAVVEHENVWGEKSSVIFEYLKIRPLLGDKDSAKVFCRLREV
jgi:hypothetical protein